MQSVTHVPMVHLVHVHLLTFYLSVALFADEQQQCLGQAVEPVASTLDSIVLTRDITQIVMARFSVMCWVMLCVHAFLPEMP